MTDFPYRPDHPDFWTLSSVVLDFDTRMDTAPSTAAKHEAYEAIVAERIHDPSLTYMAVQRARKAVAELGQPDNKALATLIATVWSEGVLTGIEVERRRTTHRNEAPDTPEGL